MSTVYLALLRGINVGGKHRLPMTDLRALFVAAGCRDVRTYIQSGNVIFTADSTAMATLPGDLTARIAARFGYQVPVVVRTAAQMDEIVRQNPFIAAGAPEQALHVLFLADRPDAARVARLDPDRSPPDQFSVRGQEVYLWLPDGAARTRLTTDYVDTTLGTTSTARNWRTVTTLAAMAV